ncbi:Restriction of telomere capping protein 5 [Massospora cicadina]|nr:Restriction of telomere capping protein 5 [Massospora cicadina]
MGTTQSSLDDTVDKFNASRDQVGSRLIPLTQTYGLDKPFITRLFTALRRAGRFSRVEFMLRLAGIGIYTRQLLARLGPVGFGFTFLPVYFLGLALREFTLYEALSLSVRFTHLAFGEGVEATRFVTLWLGAPQKSSPSEFACDETVLNMVWGLPPPNSGGLYGAPEVQTFEDVVRSFGILSGKFSAGLAESRTLMAMDSLSTRADEMPERQIDAERVGQLLGFLFNTFVRYGTELYASHQLEFPASQAAPNHTAMESTLLFRGANVKPTWELAGEFERTFPRWLDLLSQYLLVEVFLAPGELGQMIPLLDFQPQTLCAESPLSPHACAGHAARWDRLYLASQDGFSMNRFETKVFKYFGPTLTLVRGVVKATQEVLLAIYAEDAWQKSKLAWGGKSTRVFEVEPNFEPFLPTGAGEGLISYNSTCGLGVGPTAQAKSLSPEAYLLRVDASFQTAYYTGWLLYPERPTFKPARLRLRAGGFKALARQKAEWQFEASDAERRATLSALSNPKDPTSRQLLEMAGIVSEDTSVYRARSSH